MSHASELTQRIWLLLLARGDWWTPRAVDMELNLTPGSASRRMGPLVTSGTLHYRARKPQGEYTASPDCTVPKGVRASEVAEALTLREANDRPATAPHPMADTRNWLSPAELEFAQSLHLRPTP